MRAISILILYFTVCNYSPIRAETAHERIVANFGNWIKVCDQKTDNCVGVNFAENEIGEKIARFVIEPANNSKNGAVAVGTLLIPYDFSIPHLPSGSILQVDQNEPVKEHFLFCDASGCTVRFLFTQLGVKLLQSGANILIKIKDVRDAKPIKSMDIPLQGIKPLYLSLEN